MRKSLLNSRLRKGLKMMDLLIIFLDVEASVNFLFSTCKEMWQVVSLSCALSVCLACSYLACSAYSPASFTDTVTVVSHSVSNIN
jgi:hypothetical protein